MADKGSGRRRRSSGCGVRVGWLDTTWGSNGNAREGIVACSATRVTVTRKRRKQNGCCTVVRPDKWARRAGQESQCALLVGGDRRRKRVNCRTWKWRKDIAEWLQRHDRRVSVLKDDVGASDGCLGKKDCGAAALCGRKAECFEGMTGGVGDIAE